MRKILFIVLIFSFCVCFVSCKKAEKVPEVKKPAVPSILEDPEVKKIIENTPSSPTAIPKGYKMQDLVGVDFDGDGKVEYAVLGKKTVDNKRKRAADTILWIEKDGEIYWECNDMLNDKAVIDAQSITGRPFYELVVTVPIDDKEDAFNVFAYGYEKNRSGEMVFTRLFRFNGSRIAGDSVSISEVRGDKTLVTISSVSKDGDLYSGELTRFISTSWDFKGNGFVKGKQKITKNKYGKNSENPNGFYEELGIESGDLISLKPFEDKEKVEP